MSLSIVLPLYSKSITNDEIKRQNTTNRISVGLHQSLTKLISI